MTPVLHAQPQPQAELWHHTAAASSIVVADGVSKVPNPFRAAVFHAVRSFTASGLTEAIVMGQPLSGPGRRLVRSLPYQYGTHAPSFMHEASSCPSFRSQPLLNPLHACV